MLVPAAVLGTATLLPSAAQAQVPVPHPHTINQRLQDQKARIREGVKNDRLTHHEAAMLHHRDARIHAQETRDRRHDHGHLTAAEHRHLNAELNHTSKAIYHEKHHG